MSAWRLQLSFTAVKNFFLLFSYFILSSHMRTPQWAAHQQGCFQSKCPCKDKFKTKTGNWTGWAKTAWILKCQGVPFISSRQINIHSKSIIMTPCSNSQWACKFLTALKRSDFRILQSIISSSVLMAEFSDGVNNIFPPPALSRAIKHSAIVWRQSHTHKAQSPKMTRLWAPRSQEWESAFILIGIRRENV